MEGVTKGGGVKRGWGGGGIHCKTFYITNRKVLFHLIIIIIFYFSNSQPTTMHLGSPDLECFDSLISNLRKKESFLKLLGFQSKG